MDDFVGHPGSIVPVDMGREGRSEYTTLRRAHGDPMSDTHTLSNPIIDAHEQRGVIFILKHAVVIEPTVVIGSGCTVWPGVVLRGDTIIEAGAEIQAGAWLQDTTVGTNALIKPYSVCTGARIGPGVQVGPMAHLRPGTVLAEHSKVGNFVETKNAVLGPGAKASHLSYIGDAEVGANANIGAGTITCNYDGFSKHRTSIGEGAFIGSNTALVAPINVGEGAIIGAGSTLTADVPDQALTLARCRQRTFEGRAPLIRRRNKSRKEAKSD